MSVYAFSDVGEAATPATSARVEIIVPVVVCGVVLVAITTVLVVGFVVAWKKKKSQSVVSVSCDHHMTLGCHATIT